MRNIAIVAAAELGLRRATRITLQFSDPRPHVAGHFSLELKRLFWWAPEAEPLSHKAEPLVTTTARHNLRARYSLIRVLKFAVAR